MFLLFFFDSGILTILKGKEITKKQQAKNKLGVFQVDTETLGMFCQGHLSVFALLQRSDSFPEKVPEFGTGEDYLE